MRDDTALRAPFTEDHRPLLDLFHRHTTTEHFESTPKSRGEFVVPVDVKEDSSGVTIFADLPGVDEDEIHIDLEANILMISGDRDFDHDNEDPDEYLILERAYGPVKRAINIPGILDKAGMTAKYKRGVLKIRIPKVRAKAST